MIVCKFGGTSMADAVQFRKVSDILDANTERKYVVVSAPGKRNKDDIKVTDLLFECWQLAHMRKDFSSTLNRIKDRFSDIIKGLGIDFDIDSEFNTIEMTLQAMPHRDYILSRGEYLNAKIFAAYLEVPFIDPALYVRFNELGQLKEEQTSTNLSSALEGLDRAVIAGFYGADSNGAVRTFSRGGSDITGALVAEAVHADIYENWTDVSGLLAADPRVVENPHTVDYIGYRELRILSYMGASVLHADAVYPVQKLGIPINIRNTNSPEDPGSMILCKPPVRSADQAIKGITGRKGVSVVQIEKANVSDGAGYTAILLDIFKNRRIPFEQCITGIDTITVIIRNDRFSENKAVIMEEIRNELDPDTLIVKEELCMIAVVGEKTREAKNITVELLNAISKAGVEIDTINQGAGDLNLLIGVSECDFERAIQAAYSIIGGK